MQRPTMKLVKCATMRSRDCHFRIASRSMKKAITRRRLVELTAAFAASSAVAHNVQAQAYPNRIIRLIAPFPAGGSTDSAARIIAARLSELLGQQVMVDSRPGAGSNIGAEAAAPCCSVRRRLRSTAFSMLHSTTIPSPISRRCHCYAAFRISSRCRCRRRLMVSVRVGALSAAP